MLYHSFLRLITHSHLEAHNKCPQKFLTFIFEIHAHIDFYLPLISVGEDPKLLGLISKFNYYSVRINLVQNGANYGIYKKIIKKFHSIRHSKE